MFINAGVENRNGFKTMYTAKRPSASQSSLFMDEGAKDGPAGFDQFYLQIWDAAKDLLLIVNVKSIWLQNIHS